MEVYEIEKPKNKHYLSWIPKNKQNDINYMEAKQRAVAMKMQDPTLSLRELSEKTGISKSVIGVAIKKEFSDKIKANQIILDKARENVAKWCEIIAEVLSKTTADKIKTQSDLNLLTSSIKNQQALISLIESSSDSWNKINIIPVNVQVNIK